MRIVGGDGARTIYMYDIDDVEYGLMRLENVVRRMKNVLLSPGICPTGSGGHPWEDPRGTRKKGPKNEAETRSMGQQENPHANSLLVELWNLKLAEGGNTEMEGTDRNYCRVGKTENQS